MDMRTIRLFQMEIKNQCEFSFYALEQMQKELRPPVRPNTENVWFYVQSFLSSTANVSKLLFGTKEKVSLKRKPLRESLFVDEDSVIKIRDMRNHFEHFDERIEKWKRTSQHQNFADKLIGPTNMIQGLAAGDSFRHLDTTQGAIRFNGEEYLIEPIVVELRKIYNISEIESQKSHW